MARIPVEQERRGTPWWLWVVGLLILAALIWLLIGWFDPDTELNEGVVTDSLSSSVLVEPRGEWGG